MTYRLLADSATGSRLIPLCQAPINLAGDQCLEEATSYDTRWPYCARHLEHEGVPIEGSSVCPPCDGTGCQECCGSGEVPTLSFDGGQTWHQVPPLSDPYDDHHYQEEGP